MRTFFLVIQVLLVINCFAQTVTSNTNKDSSTQKVIFFEDFNDNKRNWTVGKNKDVTASMDSGVYYLTALGHAYGEAQEVKINTRKDFEIETRIKIVSGNAEHKYYFSMIFWGREAMNSYYLAFSRDGYTSVQHCDGKNLSSCTTEDSSLQKTIENPDDFNVYTIRKVGKKYFFLVNGTQVYEMAFVPFFGNLLGFGAGRKVTLAVDYLKVSYL